jgi:hypothetical protein
MCNLFLGLMLISHWFACLWCVLRTHPGSLGGGRHGTGRSTTGPSIKNRFAASRMHDFDGTTSWAGSYHSQGGTLSRAALRHPALHPGLKTTRAALFLLRAASLTLPT